MKYCCVIVTYYRNELLLRNLRHIFKQSILPDKIFIVNNNGDVECLNFLERELLPKEFQTIDYTFLAKNIGGAGGFHYGLKKAYSLGYDWYLMMDDDGYPFDSNSISNILKKCDEEKLTSLDLVLANSLVLSEDNMSLLSFGLKGGDNVSEILKISQNGIIRGEINPFNGTLISNGLINKIGFPNPEFFIKGDEVDYTNRALKANASVFTVVDSIYIHPRVKGRIEVKIFGRRFSKYVEDPVKEYYWIRNFTYSSIKNYGFLKGFIKGNFALFKRIYCVFTLKCKKTKTLKMVLKGFLHGLLGKLGVYSGK